MILNKGEIQRIYQGMNWLKIKGSIKDADFNTAFEKIKDLYEQNRAFAVSVAYSNKPRRYKDLSKEAFTFIEKRISEGHKNTYHSIMAILENKRKKIESKSEFLDKKLSIRDNYIRRFKIEDFDIPVFDEIFETCFANVLNRLV